MALGGGTFTTQNKVLPGAYINFVSANLSATLGDRGVVAMPFTFSWFPDSKVVEVTQEDFIKNSLMLFGYSYDADALMPLRDLFKYAQVAYLYKLNTGTKASCAYGTATCGGVRGNDLKIVIATNVDDTSKYDVSTYLGTTVIETQTVASAASLVDNDFIVFDKTATLEATAGTSLSGGADGLSDVTGTQYQAFLTAIEAYSFNIIATVATDAATKALFAAFTERMRDSQGVKFQCVLYGYTGDYEGVINVKNTVDAVWWVAGAEAACAINKTLTNATYNGEYDISTSYTQSQLEDAIEAGEFVFHKVGDTIRVLEDINSLTTTTDTKGDDFKSNQTIRVLDQIGNDIASIFNTKFLGKIQNNAAGRVSLWSQICNHGKQLNDFGAIEDFSDSDVTVEIGDDKKSVTATYAVTVVNAMSKLYMTVVVQ